MKVTRAGHIRGDLYATPHTQRTAATPRPRTKAYCANAHDAHTAANAVCPVCGLHMLQCCGHDDMTADELEADYWRRDWSYDALYPHKKVKA